VVTTFSWNRVLIIPLIGVIISLVCFVSLHFYSLGNDFGKVADFSPVPVKQTSPEKNSKEGKQPTISQGLDVGGHFYNDTSKWLRSLEKGQLELYHEVSTFRSILLVVIYAFYVTFSSFLICIPCHHCETPYRMMAIALVCLYGIRILCQIYNVCLILLIMVLWPLK